MLPDCVSRAQDITPYSNNLEQATESARLDYKASDPKTYDGNNYMKAIENEEDMYVIRFKTNDPPINDMYVRLDEHSGHPCTGTGVLGSNEHIIPEYTFSMNLDGTYNPAGKIITEGAIYKISPDGTETLIGFLSKGDGVFTAVS